MREPRFFDVPAGTTGTRCRFCSKDVHWIVTKAQKRMPIDVDVDGGLAPSKECDGRGIAHMATCIGWDPKMRSPR